MKKDVAKRPDITTSKSFRFRVVAIINLIRAESKCHYPIPATPPLQILAEDIGANVTISTTTKKRSPNPPPQYPELFAIEKSMFLKNRNFTFIQKIIISVVTLICFSFALQRFVSLSRLLFCSLYACETTDYFKYTSLEWNC